MPDAENPRCNCPRQDGLLACRLVCCAWAEALAPFVQHLSLPLWPQPLGAGGSKTEGSAAQDALHGPCASFTCVQQVTLQLAPQYHSLCERLQADFSAILQQLAMQERFKLLQVLRVSGPAESHEPASASRISSGGGHSHGHAASTSQSTAASKAGRRLHMQLPALPPASGLGNLPRTLSRLSFSSSVWLTGAFLSSCTALHSLRELDFQHLHAHCLPGPSVLQQLSQLSCLPALSCLDVSFQLGDQDSLADWCGVLSAIGVLKGLQHLGLHGQLCHTPQLAGSMHCLGAALSALTSLTVSMAECLHTHEETEELLYDDPVLLSASVWCGVFGSFNGLKQLSLSSDNLPLELWQDVANVGTRTAMAAPPHVLAHGGPHAAVSAAAAVSAIAPKPGHSASHDVSPAARCITTAPGSRQGVGGSDQVGNNSPGLQSLSLDHSGWALDYEPIVSCLTSLTSLALRCSDWPSMPSTLLALTNLCILRLECDGFEHGQAEPCGSRCSSSDEPLSSQCIGTFPLARLSALSALRELHVVSINGAASVRSEDLAVLVASCCQLQQLHVEADLRALALGPETQSGKALSALMALTRLDLACLSRTPSTVGAHSGFLVTHRGAPRPAALCTQRAHAASRAQRLGSIAWCVVPSNLQALRLAGLYVDLAVHRIGETASSAGTASSRAGDVDSAVSTCCHALTQLRSIELLRCAMDCSTAKVCNSSSKAAPDTSSSDVQTWWQTLIKTVPFVLTLSLKDCSFPQLSSMPCQLALVQWAHSLREFSVQGCMGLTPSTLPAMAALYVPLLKGAAASMTRLHLDLSATERMSRGAVTPAVTSPLPALPGAAAAQKQGEGQGATPAASGTCSSIPILLTPMAFSSFMLDTIACMHGLRSLSLTLPEGCLHGGQFVGLSTLSRLLSMTLAAVRPAVGDARPVMAGLSASAGHVAVLSALAESLPHTQVKYVLL